MNRKIVERADVWWWFDMYFNGNVNTEHQIGWNNDQSWQDDINVKVPKRSQLRRSMTLLSL